MTNKVLVTTDFSANSAAGVRFSLQLASQTGQSLVFYHCMPYLRPTRWSDAQYEAYASAETAKAKRSLEKFISKIVRDSRVIQPAYESVVEQAPEVTTAIIGYASAIGASAICLSTRGAGRLKKIIGTHASALVNDSPLPVFVVPKNYRRRPLKHLFYASDFNKLAAELQYVRKVSAPLKAKISVYHYDYLVDLPEARTRLEQQANAHKDRNTSFTFRKFNIGDTLAKHLLKDIRKVRPSMAVLFTDQKRGWFDRIFLSSKSVDVAHDAAIPILVVPKT